MEYPDKNINWDKLLPKLENLQNGATPDADDSAEETEQLQMAHDMSRMLKAGEEDGRFPAEEGWKRFRKELEKEQAVRRPRVRKLYWAVAAAAAVVVAFIGIRQATKPVAGPSKQDQVASVHISSKVEIKSSGKSILLGDSTQKLQWQNGASLSASDEDIVYATGDAQSATIDTLIVPRGHRLRIALADGSKVWVNAGSRLVYPSAFTGDTREVEVDGEAYFDVAADPGKPFSVRAKGMTVEVLGTRFNVNTYTTITLATLESGKVRTSAAGKQEVLKPGEQAAFDAAAGTLTSIQVDVRIHTAWKDGQLYFEEATLENITHTLGRIYDYSFRFKDEGLRNLSFTLDMPQPDNLLAVLEQIRRTTGDVQFKIEDRIVYLYRD